MRFNRFPAKGRPKRIKGQMNSLEKSYARHLESRKAIGEIVDYKYECLKLRLAHNTFFTVDFFVMLADGTLEAHETKGFMQDAANIKLKIAAEAYWWFCFRLVKAKPKKDGGGFEITEIVPRSNAVEPEPSKLF